MAGGRPAIAAIRMEHDIDMAHCSRARQLLAASSHRPVMAHDTHKLSGRLDGLTAPDHEKALHEALASAGTALTIDLADLSYVSSAGLRVLLSTAKAAKARGTSITLTKPQPSVLEVLRLSGFDTIFAIEG